MDIVVVGASGTIGQAVVAELEPRHNVVTVARSHGEFQVDIADKISIGTLFADIGPFDALVSTVGRVAFRPFAELGDEDFALGLGNKLMGQINLVRCGLDYVRDHGSFTLTTGILSDDPVVGGCCASMVNGALNAFARAVAIEMPRGVRINTVSPALLDESAEMLGQFFPGHETVPARRVARAYRKSVEGKLSGQVFRVC